MIKHLEVECLFSTVLSSYHQEKHLLLALLLRLMLVGHQLLEYASRSWRSIGTDILVWIVTLPAGWREVYLSDDATLTLVG